MDLRDRDELIKAATTSLSSKVVSHNASLLAPIAVDAVLRVVDPALADNVDLNDIKVRARAAAPIHVVSADTVAPATVAEQVVKQLGGTIDDSEMVDGLVFTKGVSHAASGPTRVTNAKVGLIQFCLSAPKTDMDNSVVVSEYSAMDRILREERKYILQVRPCSTAPFGRCSLCAPRRVHHTAVQADPKGGLQPAAGAKVYPEGRRERSVAALPGQDGHHGDQGRGALRH